MAGKHRFTPEQVAAALEQAKGFRTMAARVLGCDSETVHNYIKRFPAVRAVADAQRGLFVDEAEMALYAAVKRGEPWAVILTLKTLGKDRGYVERQEQTAPPGRPAQTQIKIVHEDGERARTCVQTLRALHGRGEGTPAE